jgi:hypothetical protein
MLYPMNINDINMGKLISDKLKEDKKSVDWLAKQICCDRSVVYKQLKKNDITISRLFLISRAFDYSFFKYLDDALYKS